MSHVHAGHSNCVVMHKSKGPPGVTMQHGVHSTHKQTQHSTDTHQNEAAVPNATPCSFLCPLRGLLLRHIIYACSVSVWVRVQNTCASHHHRQQALLCAFMYICMYVQHNHTGARQAEADPVHDIHTPAKTHTTAPAKVVLQAKFKDSKPPANVVCATSSACMQSVPRKIYALCFIHMYTHSSTYPHLTLQPQLQQQRQQSAQQRGAGNAVAGQNKHHTVVLS